jgi:UDP-glucose 6-dehydrogenase
MKNNINPLKEIVIPFDNANEFLENIENHTSNINKLIEILKSVKVSNINGGFFYYCADVNDNYNIQCEEDDTIYLKPKEIFSVKPKDFQELFGKTTQKILLELYEAMKKMDEYYSDIFQINIDNIESYEVFQKRISGLRLYFKPEIDEKLAPHINMINHLTELNKILKQNLSDVIEGYYHHVETLREKYK